MSRGLVSVWIAAFALSFVGGLSPQNTNAADVPAAQQSTAKPKSPLSPEDSLRWMQLDDGLRIEIAAAEPEVVDPVAVRFDEDGRMWVAEYRDYPNPPAPGEKPKSRIKLLEDKDGDGRFETAHVFADELLFCNGLQPWRGGVIATMSGKIAYLKDTDGDNRADVFETWYVGFAEENPQLRVNHPRFGLDNQIYVANGLRGGSVVNPRDPQAKPVSLRGHDLRFDPRTFQYEAIAGNGQFGLTFDDFGNRFLCSNRNPLMHVVFEDRYLAKNPKYVVPTVVNDVAAAGEASKVFPLVEAWTTSILHAGQFTAACGIDIFRGDALPDEYRGNSFTCEPTGSLVHREILTPSGATFTSRPAHEGREFLASRDPWFRPVYCDGGPDGALSSCDMYRAVIEHPQFVPEELKNRPDERYGEDKGRIYRIVRKDFKRPKSSKPLSKATTDELVDLLDHKSAWWRETAQRLLIERGGKSAVPALEARVRNEAIPLGRVHALWTLAGLDALSDALLIEILRTPDTAVREQALLLAEPRTASREVAANVLGAADQADDRMYFRALLSSTFVEAPDRWRLAATAATRDSSDLWLRRAVLLASTGGAADVLRGAIEGFFPSSPAKLAIRRETVRELATYAGGAADPTALQKMLDDLALPQNRIRRESFQLPLLTGLSKALKQKLPEAAGTAWVELALTTAVDESAQVSDRIDACDLLAYAPLALASAALLPLFQAEDLEIRSHAVAALAAHRDPQVGLMLLEEYLKQTPKFRAQILDAMLGRPERIVLLLDAMEAGKLKPRDLDTTRTNRLLKSVDAKSKARAEKLLAASMPADRNKALEDYRKVLTLKADARHGKEVFRKNCATCHKVGDVGVDVGPSIADLRTKTLEQVLTDVLQPNKAIDNNFVSYTVVTSDGVTLVGIVAADTPGGVTLKLPDGKTVSVLKKDIEAMESNGLSLMPEGLEKNIPHQDMADVITFVKNWRYLNGAVPGLGGATAKE